MQKGKNLKMSENRRIEVITSKENENVKRLRKLHEKKHREELKAFLVEGVKVVSEAIEYNLEKINLLVFSQEAVKKYNEFFNRCVNLFNSGKIPRIVQVPERVFEHISTTTTPQGFWQSVHFLTDNWIAWMGIKEWLWLMLYRTLAIWEQS